MQDFPSYNVEAMSKNSVNPRYMLDTKHRPEVRSQHRRGEQGHVNVPNMSERCGQSAWRFNQLMMYQV